MRQYQVRTQGPWDTVNPVVVTNPASLNQWGQRGPKPKNGAALRASGSFQGIWTANPVAPATPPLDRWADNQARSQKRPAIMSSGGVLGGDFSFPISYLPFSQPRQRPRPQQPGIAATIEPIVGPPNTAGEWYALFSEPKPHRPGLGAANQQAVFQTVQLIPEPAVDPGSWYALFSQPRPARPGLKAAEQQAVFQTVQLIPVTPAQPAEWFRPFAQPAPHRPGLKAAEQQAFFLGLPSYIGPATTAGTWYHAFEQRPHKQRQGPSPAMMPAAPFTPPYIPPPPPVMGGGGHRRRFIRRGKRS